MVNRLAAPLASLLLLPAIAAAAPAAAPPARRVAVLDFNARWAASCTKGGLTEAQEERCEVLQLFADQARIGALAVLRPPAFVVMTRENTAQILKDMGGQCSEGECEVETARLLGASVVVSGTVTNLEGNWIVSIKVHDVASAALLGGGNTSGRSKMEAFQNVRAETERMLREAVGLDGAVQVAATKAAEPAKPPPPPPPPPPRKTADPVEPPAPAVAAPAVAAPAPPADAPAEPAPAAPSERKPWDWRARPWSVEARFTFAKVSGYDTSVELSIDGALSFDLRGARRLARDWSVHAGAFLREDVLAIHGASRVELELGPIAGVVAGAAWHPLGNRWFSVEAEAGIARVANVALRGPGLDPGSEVSTGGNGTGPLLGAALRLDWPFENGLVVGLRSGASAVVYSHDLRLTYWDQNGAAWRDATFKSGHLSIYTLLTAALGYRF